MNELTSLAEKLRNFIEKPLREEVNLMINNYELDETHKDLIKQILEACDKIDSLEDKKVEKLVKIKPLKKDLHSLLNNIHEEIIKLEKYNEKEDYDSFVSYYNKLKSDVDTLNKLINSL